MHIHLIINLLTAQVIHTCLCQRSTLAAWFSVSCRRILFQNPRGLRCTAPRQCQEAGQHAEDTASLDSPEDRTNQGPKWSWIFSLVLLKHITTGEEKTSTIVPPPQKKKNSTGNALYTWICYFSAVHFQALCTALSCTKGIVTRFCSCSTKLMGSASASLWWRANVSRSRMACVRWASRTPIVCSSLW